MPTRTRKRSHLTFLLLPAMLTFIAGYFAWQSTRGDFSQEAREAVRAERLDKEAELAGLVATRERLEARVRRLRTDALDADLLDERARANLNMAFPNELVIMHRPQERPALAAHSGN